MTQFRVCESCDVMVSDASEDAWIVVQEGVEFWFCSRECVDG